MAEKRLAIIDGYSLLFRAFFATRFLSTADGRPTNALYGFTNMLFHLLENVRPDAVVVALDAPGKTFRHTEFSEYKGTRKETAPELKSQLPTARELIAALGVPSIELTGYEADDVAGTISRLAEANGYDTTIVTGDLDALQLVDDCVSVLTTRQGVTDTVTYTPAAVAERYGFGPEFIADYKALVGDTSDNIPGVPGIGAKSATDLIQKFGSIEALLERIEEVDPKYRKKLDGNEEQLKKSKWLATIDCKVPVEYDFEPLTISPEAMEQLTEMLDSLEFRSLSRRAPKVFGPYLVGADGVKFSEPAVEVALTGLEARVSDARSILELEKLVGTGPFAAYFTTGAVQESLLDESPKIALIAVGSEVRRASQTDGMELVKRHPESVVMHDAKPLYRALGGDVQAPGFDTMLAGYVLQSGRTAYALRDLIQGYLEVQPPTTPEELAVALYMLREPLADRLEKEGQTSVLSDIELPLIPILARMENTGICANRDDLREFSKQLEVTIQQTATRIYEIAGGEFTIASPKQLGEVMFDRLAIPGAVKTKTGYATGVEVLSTIDHPIAAEVLAYRELTKLKSTYADALERLIAPDGRIHTNYNQTVAATGRLSSQDPNLQNIPIRTELGRGIRKAFYAAEGYQLASFDYSQIELRVLAHMCQEPALVKAFHEREDVHKVTAQEMFSSAEVTREQRGYAKLLNYAVLYGVSEFGLAQQLGGGFSIAEAKALIMRYNERFPGVKGFMDSVVAEARAKGFTTTLLGRRRYHPDIHNSRFIDRKAAERQAMNAPLQGASADMMKLAMIRVSSLLSGSASRMLLSVHDEIVVELAEGDNGLIEPIRMAMSSALPLSVPVDVDAKVGPNWLEMTEV